MGQLNTHKFVAISAQQGKHGRVFTFPARASQLLDLCEITRAGRSKSGRLDGFQRSRIAGHIHEIRDYLTAPNAILPNSVVAGFLGGVKVKKLKGDNLYELIINNNSGKPGFIIDGQQRLTALLQTGREDFEVFVSCVLCDSKEDLRQQFILINNTRPLPKSLIYELLPNVTDLPARLGSRSFAARLTEWLNYETDSSLHGQILMHTNPEGVLRDTAIQKVIMNSAETGAIREHRPERSRADFSFDLISNYYGAVQEVFPEAWIGQSPRTSRLVHGAGIVSMGYVMETLYSRKNSITRKAFIAGLKPLRRHVAWTEGHWQFPEGGRVKWDEIENTSRQIQKLSLHLVGLVKKQRVHA